MFSQIQCRRWMFATRRVSGPVLGAMILTASLLLAACGGKEPAGSPAAETQLAAQVETILAATRQIAQQRETLAAKKAKWTYGSTVSQLTGYYEGSVLRLIEEEMRMGELGSTKARFYYTPEGRLLAYEETKETHSGKAPNAVKTERSTLRLYFRENGSMLAGEREVDGSAVPLSGIEEQAVRMHDKELQAELAGASSP